MIRKAKETDIQAIADTYTSLLTYEAAHKSHSNWKIGIYPTIAVPKANVPMGTMYVFEEKDQICASMIMNRKQAPEYNEITWKYVAEPEKVLVIHTLCIPPELSGKGYGTRMLEYAKEYAKTQRYTVIRIDTYAYNEPAKCLYIKNGFEIAGYHESILEGLIPEEQVYLEYKL